LRQDFVERRKRMPPAIEPRRGAQIEWLVRLVLFIAVAFASILLIRAETYYVDCQAGGDGRSGTSRSDPWNSIEEVNDRSFAPGDSILFKRGTRCFGMLSPAGSGTSESCIKIGAYGTGALPIVEAGGESNAVVKLFNQQYWHIETLEVVGGNPYGIHISGDKGTLHHFRIKDVAVHDTTGKVETKRSGLIAIVAGAPGQTFRDVVIDGATCFNTTQWAGIVVDGGATSYWEGTPVRAEDVTVSNCIVHDVYGDGIILFRVRNGLIEKNVTWNTGMQHTQDVGTPNAMWTWTCDNCIVQFNEGFFADSPGVDAGVFDIDWGCTDNIIQYNYAHDSQGYCASVFGAGGKTTTNSTIRYNICVNNGRSPRLAERQGDIFLSTWDGGSLDGVKIHNNTIYWNPPTDTAALLNQAEFEGHRPNVFHNNLIYSTVPALVKSNGTLSLNHNLYWYTGLGKPRWLYGDKEIAGFEDFQSSTQQERNGVFADPKLLEPRNEKLATVTSAFKLSSASPAVDRGTHLGDMGPHDFFGNSIPEGSAPDIGAAERVEDQKSGPRETAPEFELLSVHGKPYRLSQSRGRWVILSVLSLDTGPQRAIARTQSVFLRSMLYQFGEKGLQVLAVVSSSAEANHDDMLNLKYDWHLGEIPLLVDSGSPGIALPYRIEDYPATFLISPEGEFVQRWDSFAKAPQLGLTLRWLLGPPSGTAAAVLH